MVAIVHPATTSSRGGRQFRSRRAIAVLLIASLAIMWIMKQNRIIDNVDQITEQEQHLSLLPNDIDIAALEPRFRFLQHYNPHAQQSPPVMSDLAELRHCNLQNMDWNDFFSWSSHILDVKMPQFRETQAYQNFTEWNDMQEEFVVQLLEIYATFHHKCQFHTFPFVPSFLPPAAQVFDKVLLSSRTATSNSKFARLAIVIIAFQDAPQLKRLIQAVYMPHHYIVIHVERRTSPEFLKKVHSICSQYVNVVVLQFGTIIYRTDLITNIQLQLMKWFTTTSPSKLKFDYYVALNGAAYPLYAAEELALHLALSSREVWLGELTTGPRGERVRTSQASMLLGAKRLAYSRSSTTNIKGTFRFPQSLIEQDGVLTMNVSQDLYESMSSKTVSGNQAVYSYNTIQQLLSSPPAMELFALAKYACCGILEEITWIAAMKLLGLGDEALHEAGCMWQVWGGATTETCQSSVNNAILTRNASICFKVEDYTRGSTERQEGKALYIHGNEIWTHLENAKKRGFLFARKFQTTNVESMALLDDIRNKLHNNSLLL